MSDSDSEDDGPSNAFGLNLMANQVDSDDEDDDQPEEAEEAAKQDDEQEQEPEEEKTFFDTIGDDVDEDSVMPSANGAFDDGEIDVLELNPFRTAAAAIIEPKEKKDKAKSKKVSGKAPVKVFVGGLDHATNEGSLTKKMSQFGKVHEVHIPRTGAGKSRGFAFVTFMGWRDADRAINQKNVMIDGRSVRINLPEERKKRTGVPWEEEQRAPDPNRPPKQKREKQPIQPPAEGDEGEEAGPYKKQKKKKEEIVTITTRKNAEPLFQKNITMRELFPKEFWRV